MEGSQGLSHEVNVLSLSRKYSRNRKAAAKSAPRPTPNSFVPLYMAFRDIAP
jgi:hypothetical protein